METNKKKARSKDRGTILKTELLNSSDKRMDVGQTPGPIKTTAEIHRNKNRRQQAGKPTETKPIKPDSNKK